MTTRRSFTAEFKVKVVLELISGEKGLAQASREYGIKDTVLSRWKQEFLANALQLFEQPKEVQEKALVEVYGCSVQVACQIVGLAHSTFYYQLQPTDESGLCADLEQEAGRHPTYGSRRLTHQLRRAPYRYGVNRSISSGSCVKKACCAR